MAELLFSIPDLYVFGITLSASSRGAYACPYHLLEL
jgi:hypothetical protein